MLHDFWHYINHPDTPLSQLVVVVLVLATLSLPLYIPDVIDKLLDELDWWRTQRRYRREERNA